MAEQTNNNHTYFQYRIHFYCVDQVMRSKKSDKVFISVDQIIHQADINHQNFIHKMPPQLQELFLKRLIGSTNKTNQTINITKLHLNHSHTPNKDIKQKPTPTTKQCKKIIKQQHNPQGCFKNPSQINKNTAVQRSRNQLRLISGRYSVNQSQLKKSFQQRPSTSQSCMRKNFNFMDSKKIKRQGSLQLQKKDIAKLNRPIQWDQKQDKNINRNSFPNSRKSVPYTRSPNRSIQKNRSGCSSNLSRNQSFQQQNKKSRVKTQNILIEDYQIDKEQPVLNEETLYSPSIGSKVYFKHFNLSDLELMEMKRKGTKDEKVKIRESNFVKKMKRTKQFFYKKKSEQITVQDLERKQIEFLQLFKKDYCPRKQRSFSGGKPKKLVKKEVDKKRIKTEKQQMCGWEVNDMYNNFMDEY